MRFNAGFPLFSHIVKTLYFIFLGLSLSGSLLAQEWPTVYWLDEEAETLKSIEADSSLRVWNGEFWEVEKTLNFNNIDVNDFEGVDALMPIPSSDPLHFVAQGTQQVYTFNSSTSEFSRVDATYHRGYNFNSIKWYHNDTLFSLGGYGFWHTHGVLSYFSNSSKEWHVIPTSGGPLNVTNDFYQISDDGRFLYVTYSAIIHGSEVANDPTIWRLNLRTYVWEKLGVLNESSIEAIDRSKRKLNLPFGVILGNGQNQLLDLQHNRLDYLEPSVIDLRFSSNNSFSNGRGAVVGKQFYLNFQVPTSSNIGRSVSLKYDYDKILNARRNPEEVYKTGWPTWIYISIGLVGVGLLWLLWLLYRKLRQPFLKGSTVEAEELFFRTLERQEVTLLKALLRSEMRGEGLKSAPITEIMGWQRKSWDNQRKWRNNLIKELNKRAEENLNIPELIYREKDPQDKRERVYRLNGDGFRLLRDSIHFN